MPYANLSDAKIFYEIYGSELRLEGDKTTSKPSLVVLHGAGIDHTYLVPFLGQCSKFSQVIFLNHRGHGRSQYADHHWNLKTWGNDVFLFCEALGIQKPFVLGVSFGGHVAMQYSILHPDHAAGLILIDTEGEVKLEDLLNAFERRGGLEIRQIAESLFKNPTPENQFAYMQKCLPLCTTKPMQTSLFKYCIQSPEVSHHYTQTEFLSGFNFIPQLKNVTSPILYLSGSSSPLHTPENARRTAASFTSQIEFKVFEKAGLVSADAQEEAIEMINSFLLKHHSA